MRSKKKGEYKEVNINIDPQQNDKFVEKIAYTSQQESLFLAHYMKKQKPTTNNMINLKFKPRNTDQKQWKLICDQDTKSKLKVGIICSISNKIYYHKQDIMWEFHDQIAIIAKEFITKIPLTFVDYAEDFDSDDEDHVNEMPLYILRIRCKTIFFNLFNKFQKSYCWLKCRCRNPSQQRETQNMDISRQLNIDSSDYRKAKRFLLIGPANSGKNTFIKQLRMIHGGGYNNKDRKDFIKYIRWQIIEQMQNVIDEFNENERKTQLQVYDDGIAGAISTIDDIKFDQEVIWSDNIVDAIEILWSNERIQSKAEMMNGHNAEFRVYDSSIYFWNELERIKQNDYIPTDKDIILAKYGLKSGCMETIKFNIRGTKFIVTKIPSNMLTGDDRRKWLGCFDDITAVIFVANSDHPSVDSMQSEVELFDNICNSRWFRTQSRILFLNKRDILAENIKTIPFDGGGLDEYDGPNELQSIMSFIRKTFLERNKSPRDKQIYSHITVATDKNNVKRVFDDVQHVVISASLQRNGLLGFPSKPTKTKQKQPKMLKVPDKSVRESEIMEMVQLNQVLIPDGDLEMETNATLKEEIPTLKKELKDTKDKISVLKETVTDEDLLKQLAMARKDVRMQRKSKRGLTTPQSVNQKTEQIKEDVLELKEAFTDLNVLVADQSVEITAITSTIDMEEEKDIDTSPTPIQKKTKKKKSKSKSSRQKKRKQDKIGLPPKSSSKKNVKQKNRNKNKKHRSRTKDKDKASRKRRSSITTILEPTIKKDDRLTGRRTEKTMDHPANSSEAIQKRLERQAKHERKESVKPPDLFGGGGGGVPAAPQSMPSAPQPMPSAPQPMPSAPQPMPSAPQPMPSAPQPMPSAPQPMPSAIIQPSRPPPPQPATMTTSSTSMRMPPPIQNNMPMQPQYFNNNNNNNIPMQFRQQQQQQQFRQAQQQQQLPRVNAFMPSPMQFQQPQQQQQFRQPQQQQQLPGVNAFMPSPIQFQQPQQQQQQQPQQQFPGVNAFSPAPQQQAITAMVPAEEEELLKKKKEEEELAKQREIELEQKRMLMEKKKKSKLKSAMTSIRKKIAEWKAARKLIDNVFADLENMFYLLSELLVKIELQSLTKPKEKIINTDSNINESDEYSGMEKCKVVMMNVLKIFSTPFVYLLVIIAAVFVILPSCFFLLIVRMNKIETKIENVDRREKQIESETKWQRFVRVLNQLMRSSFMFSFLVIYPIIIIYVIIPYFGETNDNVIIISISSYLFIVLLLQMFGTWRGVKSFEERKKLKPNEERYKPQKFVWNLGSSIAILLLFYEVFQLAIFAYQTTTDGEEGMDETTQQETTFSADSFDFIDSQKILKFTNVIVGICYLSLDFIDNNILEYYFFFSIVFVGLMILFFIYRFIYELKVYGNLKWKQKNPTKARQIWFHSFVGTIIYGHGKLKHVNKWNAKIISLLADSFFLGICQKIILILSCDNDQFLRIDPTRKCWQNEHKLYSCLALILLGYYIPICVMIAPMFQEDIEIEENTKEEEEEEKDQESEEEKKGCCCCKKKVKEEEEEEEEEEEVEQTCFKQFASFTNTIAYVAPYMSAFTVMECFMLITSEFISKGGEYGTIISQLIAMCGLLYFTITWSFKDLQKYGLTQNEPVFPFGISIIKVLAFFCGLIGCILEILRYNKIIDIVLELFLLFVSIIIIAIIFAIVFLKYHTFFNPLDDDLNTNVFVKFNSHTNVLNVVKLEVINENENENEKKKKDDKEDKKIQKEEIIIPWATDNQTKLNIMNEIENNNNNNMKGYH